MNNLIDRYLDSKFIRFALVGLLSAAIEYTLYYVLTLFINYQAANVGSFALTNVVTFILSRRFVFTSKNENKAEEASLFVLCLLGALLVSQSVLWSLVEYGNINDKIAKAFAIGVAVIWNYFTRKHIVFRTREESVEMDESPAAVSEPIDDNDD